MQRVSDWAGPLRLIRVFPVTALNDALREVMIEGASLAQVGGKLGIVTAWGVVAFVIAVRLFKWR